MSSSFQAIIKKVETLLAVSKNARPVVVLTGAPGIGKSTLARQLQESLEQDGARVRVCDLGQQVADDAIISEHTEYVESGSSLLIVAAESVSGAVYIALGSAGIVISEELQAMNRDDLRVLLSEHCAPYSFREAAIIENAQGNPAEAIKSLFLCDGVDHTADQSWVELSADPELAAIMESWSTGRTIITRQAGTRLGQITEFIRLLQVSDWSEAARQIPAEAPAIDDDARSAIHQFLRLHSEFFPLLEAENADVRCLYKLMNETDAESFPTVYTFVLLRIAQYYFAAGNTEMSKTICGQGIDFANAGCLYLASVPLRLLLIDLLMEQGRYDEAGQHIDDLDAFYVRGGFDILLTDNIYNKAMLLEARQHYVEARALLESLVFDCDADMLNSKVPWLLSYLRCKTGDADEGYLLVGDVSSHRPSSNVFGYYYCIGAIRILAQFNTDRAEYAKWKSVIEEFCSVTSNSTAQAALMEADGWINFVEGDVASAQEKFSVASRMWLAEDCFEENRRMLELVENFAELPTYSNEAANVHSVEVASDATALDSAIAAPTANEIVDAALNELLTKREREVASLVSEGMTNPEIAGSLHLSARTVEHHVSAILRKLELPNRRSLVFGRISESRRNDILAS